MKLVASLCEIYYRFLMKCFVVKLNASLMCLKQESTMGQYFYVGLMFDEQLFGLQNTPKSWCNCVEWNSKQHQIFERSWMCDCFECFCFFVIYLENLEEHFATTTTQVTAQGNWWTMPINIFYVINDSNMLDLFHHLKTIILHLSSR